jgi:spermidine/putrescine transport system substrate-binding protein
VKSWSVFTNTDYAKKITAKNNIRDSYFVGLAMYYENELQTLKTQYEQRELTRQEYQAELSRLMNDSSPETMSGVKAVLQSMTSNLYGFETDEGKNDTIAGKITVNYQWSGDGVYIMDTAEEGEEDEGTENPVYLNYCIPETVSNLWFDGWVLTKDCKDVDAATMFINFMSRPDVAVRNMNYIGYTSCIGSDEVFNDFVLDYYAADEECETKSLYDLNYFFNPSYDPDDPTTKSDDYIFYAEDEQFYRQLFAQYPQESVLARCVAMQYFDADANSRANSMWSDITFF